MNKRIGVGIITCNRPDMFRKCYNSIPFNSIHELCIVNDGQPFKHHTVFGEFIQHEDNKGVGGSKNDALKYLLSKGCDYIFLIEDDMEIIDPDIFNQYIKVSEYTGIEHMMFAYHGPANKGGISGGVPKPRITIEYTDDIGITLNEHCVGALCFYTKKSLESVGLIDEKYKNAFDHVSHSYSLALKGYSTPYWWWTDIKDSTNYIREQACSEQSSSIKTPEKHKIWMDNINESIDRFRLQFGVYPFGQGGVQSEPEEKVLNFLKKKRKEVCDSSKS